METGPTIRLGARTITLKTWPTVGQALPVLYAAEDLKSGNVRAFGQMVEALAAAINVDRAELEALTFDELDTVALDFSTQVRRPATPHP